MKRKARQNLRESLDFLLHHGGQQIHAAATLNEMQIARQYQ